MMLDMFLTKRPFRKYTLLSHIKAGYHKRKKESKKLSHKLCKTQLFVIATLCKLGSYSACPIANFFSQILMQLAIGQAVMLHTAVLL